MRLADPFHIDGFAGGGGASEGYYLATGRHADLAWNHDRQAVAMHRANHPFTKHFCEDKTGKAFEIKLTKTAQVRMCGNSVCPPMAEALFRLNLPAEHLIKQEAA